MDVGLISHVNSHLFSQCSATVKIHCENSPPPKGGLSQGFLMPGFFALLDLIFLATAPAHAQRSLVICERPGVIDGDTFRCADRTRVRVWGLDAPELATPAGPASMRAMATMLAGQTLTCQRKGKSHDRVVARCTLPDGRDIAAEMIRQGQGREWVKFSKAITGAFVDG